MATLWMVHRYQLRLDNMPVLKKVLLVLFAGYCLALTFIHISNLQWEKPLLFLSMISFCPFFLFLVFLLKRYEYKGDLNILILVIMLNSIGFVILYRLDINSKWFLTEMVGYKENIPMAFKHLVYSMIALLGVVIGISKGLFNMVIEKIEKRNDVLGWGIIAFALLALPKLFGFSTVSTQERSFQPSEFAFKIIFLIFIAKYYESKASELVLRHYPIREVLKLVIFVFSGVTIFFFLPLVLLQKELGTALLIGVSFIILTTYVTNRFSFFLAGITLIALAIYAGTFLSVHVEQRVIAAWINYKEYAFQTFKGGSLYPGYQIFTAIAAIRMSPWGVGLGNGILKNATMESTIVPKAVHDFVAIPVASEMGILGIFIIVMGYLILLDKAIPPNRSLTFRKILAAGIVIALLTQGLYNLSSVFAILPATGIPLPWISYGGSALFANYILVGLLAAILDKNGVSAHEE
jgi:cell division protein FtsW (lipid II flippase)